ncbi:MAG: hypothetical protein QOE29_370, partial [Gaiellaceae bacterium]|nr:hypothetical protein [Gaiellaceae bacterium]
PDDDLAHLRYEAVAELIHRLSFLRAFA